jgi:hypothetical protein
VLFRSEAVLKMDLRTTGMEFASEMVVKATLRKMKIAEVPTTLSPDGRNRPPHLRSWRDGWRHLRFLLLYSPRWLFLYPGMLLMLVGLLTGAMLLGGPVHIGGVGFDIHTLLYSAVATVIGFQAISFAVFTKVFAISEGLLPEDRRLKWLYTHLNLEAGLIIGALLILFGIGASAYEVSSWRAASFGPLDPTRTLRVIIPAATALTLGSQIMLSSFFHSVLGLSRR